MQTILHLSTSIDARDSIWRCCCMAATTAAADEDDVVLVVDVSAVKELDVEVAVEATATDVSAPVDSERDGEPDRPRDGDLLSGGDTVDATAATDDEVTVAAAAAVVLNGAGDCDNFDNCTRAYTK